MAQSDPDKYMDFCWILERSSLRREKVARYSIPGKAIVFKFGSSMTIIDWGLIPVAALAGLVSVFIYAMYFASYPGNSLVSQIAFFSPLALGFALLLRSIFTFKILLISSEQCKIIFVKLPFIKIAKAPTDNKLLAHIGKVYVSRTYNFQSIREFWLVSIVVGDCQFPLCVLPSRQRAEEYVRTKFNAELLEGSQGLPRVFGFWLF